MCSRPRSTSSSASLGEARGPARTATARLAVIGFLAPYGTYGPEWWPELLPAVGVTLALTACAFAFAVVLALLLALGKLGRNPPIRALSIACIELMRGIPALAILFLLYFGLVPLGIVLRPFTAGFVGLGLSAAGYLAEVFRAGIEATHKGQREAALAVGMTSRQPFADRSRKPSAWCCRRSSTR